MLVICMRTTRILTVAAGTLALLLVQPGPSLAGTAVALPDVVWCNGLIPLVTCNVCQLDFHEWMDPAPRMCYPNCSDCWGPDLSMPD